MAPGSLAWEVPPEQGADTLDARDRPLAVAPVAVVLLHALAHRLPLTRLDAPRDAAGGDDLDAAIGEQNVDENAVVVCGIPDAELPEQLQRALPRRQAMPQLGQIEGGLDHEANLAAVVSLTVADRLLDGVAHRRAEMPPRAPARREQMTDQTPQLHALTSSTRRRRHRRPHPPRSAPPPPAPPPPPRTPPQPPPTPPPRG